MSDGLRAFSQFLTAVENGELHGDLTSALRDLVGDLNNAYANAGGKPKAKLVLAIDLALDGKAGVIEVSSEIKTTPPKQVRGKSVFWSTPENNLCQSNPRQMDLDIRSVHHEREVRFASKED